MAGEPVTTKASDNNAEKKPAKLGWWEFLNSQFGLWLLGSVVLSLVATMWNVWQSSENRQKADSEFVATLIPYLTDSNMEVRVRAVQVIQGRYSGDEIPANINTLMCNSLSDFGDFRHQVNDILGQHADDFLSRQCSSAAPTAGIPGPSSSPSPESHGTTTPTPVVSPVNPTRSCTGRVYIQIYSEEQRQRAAAIQQALRNCGFVVPGIENIANTKPELAKKPVKPTSVFYFNAQDSAAAKEIGDLLQHESDVHDPQVESKSLPANPGTIEIWFAPQDLKQN